MLDPKLYEAMQGKSSPSDTSSKTAKKDRFELALDECIKEEVDRLMLDEDPTKIKLVTPEIRRKQLEAEKRKELQFTEFEQSMITAVRIIRNEGQNLLTPAEYDIVKESLNHLNQQLQQLELNNLDNEKLKNALVTPQENLACILKIGIAKYSEKQLEDSLSIFAFLATIDSQNPDYWFRLGSVAEEMERYDLAIQAYSAVNDLAPEFADAHIFKAKCCIHNNKLALAAEELPKIKHILQSNHEEKKWEEYVNAIENVLVEVH